MIKLVQIDLLSLNLIEVYNISYFLVLGENEKVFLEFHTFLQNLSNCRSVRLSLFKKYLSSRWKINLHIPLSILKKYEK